MKIPPRPMLSDVEQLRNYQQLLAEMVVYVDPTLKEPLKAELANVKEQIRRLLNHLGGGSWPGRLL